MKDKVLIIGNPFFKLEETLNKNKFTYVVSSSEDCFDIALKDFRFIILVGVNFLLNNSKLKLMEYVISQSRKDAVLISWTHEPFWDYRNTDVEYIFGKKIYIYNVYNKKVFSSIFSCYFGVGGILWSPRVQKIELPSDDFLYKKFLESKKSGKSICAYASCFNDFRLDIPNSLMRLRNNTIKQLYDAKCCDVYGKGWKGEWDLEVTEESRQGLDGKSWGEVKVRNIQQKYLFSLCLENSLVENYVTEKFAQAIESYTIPIYVFGNGLEQYFNVDDAIQLSNTGSNLEKVIKIVKNMTFEEYLTRLKSLVSSYNKIIAQVEYIDHERIKPAIELVGFLNEFRSK